MGRCCISGCDGEAEAEIPESLAMFQDLSLCQPHVDYLTGVLAQAEWLAEIRRLAGTYAEERVREEIQNLTYTEGRPLWVIEGGERD